MTGLRAAPRRMRSDLDLVAVERSTLSDQVHEQLSEFLISGRLAPGDQLSLRGLSQTLGVSVMPVREAVARLTADSALEVMPNRAIRVPDMPSERFRDLTRIRIAVESFAAAEAAKLRSAEDLTAVSKAEEAFRLEAQKDDPDPVKVVALNKNFHFAVYRAAQSHFLMEIVRSLWLKAGPIINVDFRGRQERLAGGGALKRHGRILRAVAERDPEKSGDAVADDIQTAADFILSRL